MKKITLILFFFLFINFGYSQTVYSNYFDMTSEWRNSYNGVGTLWYSTTYFDGYEIFNSTTYYRRFTKRLNYIFTNNGNYTTELLLSQPSYVREDAAGKFYIYDPSDGNEYVYYDNQQIINSQVGDPFPSNQNSCSVESIEINYLGSLPLKRIKGNPSCNSCGTLEGIGDVGPTCGLGIEGNQWLNCYTKQGVSLQFGTIDCNSFPSPERIYLSTSVNNISENKLIVYPNPAKSFITIKSESQELKDYEIYNIQGSIIKKGQFKNQEQVIDIANFTNGVYILKISGQNIIEYRKIVKE